MNREMSDIPSPLNGPRFGLHCGTKHGLPIILTAIILLFPDCVSPPTVRSPGTVIRAPKPTE